MSSGPPVDPGREAIVQTLERHGVRYVVIGGAAAQARGWPEPTDYIDVTPERSEENLERLAIAVRELGGSFRVDPVRYPDGYQPPGGIDVRTFRNQVSLSFTTCHGDFDVVLIPTGPPATRTSPRPRRQRDCQALRSLSRWPRLRRFFTPRP